MVEVNMHHLSLDSTYLILLFIVGMLIFVCVGQAKLNVRATQHLEAEAEDEDSEPEDEV